MRQGAKKGYRPLTLGFREAVVYARYHRAGILGCRVREAVQQLLDIESLPGRQEFNLNTLQGRQVTKGMIKLLNCLPDVCLGGV